MLSCQHLIKSLLFSCALMIALFTFNGCSDNHQMDSKEISLAQIQPVVVSTKENDKQFLVRAVELKYEQILMAKLAYRRAGSEEVKNLATILEDANRNSKSALASLGIIKSIAVPSGPTTSAQAAYDNLNQETVEDFDVAYVRLAIQGYNAVISHFEAASHLNIDPDIKSMATAMLPELRSHLSMAKNIDAHQNPISEAIR